MSWLIYLLLFINVLLLVSGQFVWKHGLMGTKYDFGSIPGLLSLFISPYILTGIVIYIVATGLWLFILSKSDLSIAYPIQSSAYIIAVFGSYYLFQEPLTFGKIIGCIFIMIGVLFIALSANS